MLERYGIITAVVPSCEWSYEQPLSQGGVQRIPPRGCAGDDATLVRQVRDYRAINRIGLDNLEHDIAEYIKAQSPQNNRFPGRLQNPAFPPRRTRPIRPLIERMTEWMMVTLAEQPILLLPDDAERRALVCVECPQNIQWRTGCAPCCEEIVQRGNHLRQRIEHPAADALKGCRCHNFYLPAAVFLDRDSLGDPNEEAPAACWMRTEPRTHAKD